MGTITHLYYRDITNDDSMDTNAIKDLISMLKDYLREKSGEEE